MKAPVIRLSALLLALSVAPVLADTTTDETAQLKLVYQVDTTLNVKNTTTHDVRFQVGGATEVLSDEISLETECTEANASLYISSDSDGKLKHDSSSYTVGMIATVEGRGKLPLTSKGQSLTPVALGNHTHKILLSLNDTELLTAPSGNYQGKVTFTIQAD